MLKNLCYPEPVEEVESSMVRERREKAGVSQDRSAVGVAFSGGGIRSATQSLGFFQSLCQKGLDKYVDFMSTVSGGGYFGGFLGRIYDTGQFKPDCLDNSKGHIKYLRNSGNYLAPNGEGDLLRATVDYIKNWTSVLFVMMSLVMTLFLLARILPVFDGVPQALSVGNYFISIYMLIPALILMVGILPLIWSSWLSNSWKIWAFGAALSVVGILLFFVNDLAWPYLYLIALPASTCLWSLGIKHIGKTTSPHEHAYLTAGILGTMSLAMLMSLAFSVADSLGYFFYAESSQWKTSGLSGTAAFLVILLTMPTRVLSKPSSTAIGKLLRNAVIPLVMMSAAIILVGSAAAFSHWVAWNGGLATSADINGIIVSSNLHQTSIITMLAVIGSICYAFGKSYDLVNDTSANSFFASRLIRSFLGAANPNRIQEGNSLTQVHENDDIRFVDYKPWKNGGPVHIVNVVINETVDGRNKLHQTIRRGINMGVGPAGFAVGVRHHAVYDEQEGHFVPVPIPDKDYHAFGDKAFEPEDMTLGRWMSISAAGATTGMGTKTKVIASMLLGLLNVRLGYWWDSGLERSQPHFFATQRTLVSEYVARFPGTSLRRWYLSDGGHFDNSASYELIRRRVPLMIFCDYGRDDQYQFSDLSDMIRLARNDFGAEIELFSNAELDAVLDDSVRPLFGVPADMERDKQGWDGADILGSGSGFVLAANDKPHSKVHAALMKIIYQDGQVCYGLYIKPTITGDEPEDVKRYRVKHPKFPHEPTEDQFFDEQQWECYRKLSEHTTLKIFADNERNTGGTPYEWVRDGVYAHLPSETDETQILSFEAHKKTGGRQMPMLR